MTKILIDRSTVEQALEALEARRVERLVAQAVAQEQDRCCKIVYGMAGSDNVAQRIVDAIRRKE